MNTDRRQRILVAAREAFLRFGYRRVGMGEIAAAAGISRPALYLVFKNKEDIFKSVYEAWVAETIAAIEADLHEKALAKSASPREQLLTIFEWWTVRPFELVRTSSEAKEVLECDFDFARVAQEAGHARFEAMLVPSIRLLVTGRRAKPVMTAERMAHVLAAAVGGFKQIARTPRELRLLIADLVVLSLG